jgi:hypothetical protein
LELAAHERNWPQEKRRMFSSDGRKSSAAGVVPPRWRLRNSNLMEQVGSVHDQCYGADSGANTADKRPVSRPWRAPGSGQCQSVDCGLLGGAVLSGDVSPVVPVGDKTGDLCGSPSAPVGGLRNCLPLIQKQLLGEATPPFELKHENSV